MSVNEVEITCPHCGVTGVDNTDYSVSLVGSDVTPGYWHRTQDGMRLYKCLACGGGIRKPKRFRKDLHPVPATEWEELERAWDKRAAEERERIESLLGKEWGDEAVARYRELTSRREEDKKSPDERKALLAADVELFGYSDAGWTAVAVDPFGFVFDKGKSRISVSVDEWGEIVAMPQGREADEFLSSRPSRRSFGFSSPPRP
jgi:hypothetical protein